MELLLYRGVSLGVADLGTAVSAAAGGLPPAPRRAQAGEAPVDGATWLVGLVDATADGPFAEGVRRALDLVLRTGDSKRLDVLAEVAEQRDVLDVGAMVATLARPHVWRTRETPPRLGRAISVAVCGGRASFDPELRTWVAERRMRGALIPACLAGDPEWFLENLASVLGDDETLAATRLDHALASLSEPLRAERARAVAAATDRLGPRLRDALGEVLARHGVAEAEPPVPPLDVDRLPWHGEDGRWFELPRGVEVLMGGYRITRGISARDVDPDAVAPYEISGVRARAMLGGQAEALWSVARDTIRAALPRTRSGEVVRERLPERLAAVLGEEVSAALGRTRPPPAPLLDDARDRLRALVADEGFRRAAGQLADTLRAAADRLKERARDEGRAVVVDLTRKDDGEGSG